MRPQGNNKCQINFTHCNKTTTKLSNYYFHEKVFKKNALL